MRTKFLLFLVLFVIFSNNGLATENLKSESEPEYDYYGDIGEPEMSETITSTTTTTTTTTSTTPRTTSSESPNLNKSIEIAIYIAEASTLPPPLILNTTTIALVTEKDKMFSKYERIVKGEYETILNTLRQIGAKDEPKSFRFMVILLFTILGVCAIVITAFKCLTP